MSNRVDPSSEQTLPPLAQSPASEGDLASALRFVHNAVGSGIVDLHNLQAHVYALTEALISRGTLSLRDFEERKKAAEAQAQQQLSENWEGARVYADETDKYEVETVKIDCDKRMHLCKAACCRLEFFLSKQDLEEGVIRWEFSKPYLIRQRDDGYCVHNHPQTRGCTAHEHRPIVCRQYDCTRDARIWVDFENRIPNPELAQL